MNRACVNLCAYKAHLKASIQIHLSSALMSQAAVHKDTRILYGCDECEKNFTSITNYRRHKIMIHGPGKQAYHCDRYSQTKKLKCTTVHMYNSTIHNYMIINYKSVLSLILYDPSTPP